ncbi:hypothetical protein D046_3109, partial [Vibrio parahaemolyticus V-223/04]
MISLFSGAFW